MESNELRIFKAVAEEGSITKAAQTLGYVQSNVTARIQQLEAELKTQLFYRQHGMILTPAGVKLSVYAEKIIHLLDEGKKSLNDSAAPSGSLSIGANHTLSSLNIPSLLSQYHKSYSQVNLSLTTSHSEDLIYKILHFQLDCAFVNIFSIKDDSIVKELIFEENLVLISNLECNKIEDLFLKSFLMYPTGCSTRAQLENWLRLNGVTNIRFMEFNNLHSIIEGVLAGLGVSFVPKSAVKKYIEEGSIKYFTIPSQYSTTKTFFIRHKDSLKTSALTKFIDLIELKTPYGKLFPINLNT
ncbi:LysR family transcriptional regulator [Clostridium pasteurianum]|uniref:Transcriptional regulator n=1 Tax=Clostridium pasteurianum BC1 TaxID=86416 RepID=R4K7V1_CLOPA|nr:LysR family transcriptional regulator [Clostridium pasteurianum]AGK98628.1 transcriptional regulator [Clostridium pasteurianum BC1]